jgi:uncharacterized protein (AIM24 family)
MSRHTIQEFIAKTAQKDLNQGEFELENERMLEINLNGMIWTKTGSMVAYRGDIKFTREGVFDRGIGNLLKKAVSGEGAKLTKAQGRGKLYLADSGKKITVLNLQNETLFVNGNDVLALDDTLTFDVRMMRKVSAMVSGGLFNIEVKGTGMLAITTHYDPLTLVVTPDNPVYTDPNATIAWSGSLTPEFKTDISLKTLFGRGSGESFQMMFKGNGFVVIQPYEEVFYQPG